MKEILDVVYREIGDITLRLDLFLPEKGKNPPLILWIHGGAWMMGDSYLLRNELEKYGIKVAMHTVYGGGHGFNSPVVDSVVNAFLDYHFGIFQF